MGLRRILTTAGNTSDAQADLLRVLTGERIDGVDLPAADQMMLEYADKLTRTPSAMTVADVARLRAGGFSDRAIHDGCALVAYFAVVNRIADGLGVELEAQSSL